MRMAGSLTVSVNRSVEQFTDNPSVSDDTGSATENEGDDDDEEDDDIDLNSDVVAALLDGHSGDGDDGNDSWEDIDVQEENL